VVVVILGASLRELWGGCGTVQRSTSVTSNAYRLAR
jgi:hypothetical protein